MRDYGKVYTKFWTSDDIQGLSEDGRTLALYLLTCPHGNMLGCFVLPFGYASEDLVWDSERVKKGFAELSAKGYAERDESTKFVFVTRYLKWNLFENPNVAKAAAKLFDSLGAPQTMKAKLAAALREFSANFPASVLEKFESSTKPFGNPSALSTKTRTTTEPEPEPKPEPQPSHGSAPAKAAAPEKAESSQTWGAYASAYEVRYSTPPVRNGKINSQLVQFVRRLGSEAPQVAAFYVRHNAAYYVRKMHDVGSMLTDAEKLRTEWATNSQMTAARALQVDKTQTNFEAFGQLIAEAEAREGAHGQ